MGAIGQLDEDDPHVARHGQKHFAKGFRLVFFPGVEFQLLKLGQAVHQFSDWGAKTLNQLRFGHATVFDGVVQQRCHQRLCVQLPLCALLGNRNRMRNVGLTAVAELAQVCLVGKPVSLAYAVHIGRRHVVQFCRENGKTRCGGVGRCRRWFADVLGRKQCAHALNVSRHT